MDRVRLAWASSAVLLVALGGGCVTLLGDFANGGVDAGGGGGEAGRGDSEAAGDAGPCSAGADCSEAGSCQAATIACASGTPVCTNQGNASNGKTCGTNLYCDNGACAACANGAPCTPTSNPCNRGSAVCADGGLTCDDLGTSADAGVTCGTNEVCDGTGHCASCTSGNQCNPSGNLCETGTTSCATGVSTCSNLTDVMANTSCGGGMVCDGNGHCIAPCTPSSCPQGCCNPTTQGCVPYANQTGTLCGNTGAQCHSCAVGTSTPGCSTIYGTCDGTIIGQIGTNSVVVDLDTDGTYVFFADESNYEIGQVSAYSIGAPTLLSGVLPGLHALVYDSSSSVVLFVTDDPSSGTDLYKATPNVANSATLIKTLPGNPDYNSLALSPTGQIDIVTFLSSASSTASNCSIAGSCTSLANFSSGTIGGVTWPATLSEPLWADTDNGAIDHYMLSCSCFTALIPSLTSPTALINDGTYLYWQQAASPFLLQRAAVGGGAVQNLGVANSGLPVNNLVTDGKYLYWSGELGGVQGIYYMPIAGGTAQLVTPTQDGVPVRVHKETMTGQMVIFYGDNTNGTVDKVIAPP